GLVQHVEARTLPDVRGRPRGGFRDGDGRRDAGVFLLLAADCVADVGGEVAPAGHSGPAACEGGERAGEAPVTGLGPRLPLAAGPSAGAVRRAMSPGRRWTPSAKARPPARGPAGYDHEADRVEPEVRGADAADERGRERLLREHLAAPDLAAGAPLLALVVEPE